ncbi:MAG: cytochrome P450 [Stackebrandtia sp.]
MSTAATDTLTATAYAALRAERGDVYFDDDLGAWLILGYTPARQVLGSDGWSSNPSAANAALATALAEAGVDTEMFPQLMIFADPPEHTRLRGAVRSSFTPGAVGRLRERIDAIADAAVSPLPTGRPFDLLAEVARPFPLAVISELLDIGTDGAELLWTETPRLVRLLDFTLEPESVADSAAAFAALAFYLLPLVVDRRRHPGGDLLSQIAADPNIAPDEVVVTAVLLAVAGHETTANLVTNGALSLLRHPDQLGRLMAQPALMERAVTEVLRLDGPVQIVARTATVDHRLEPHLVRTGDQVIVVIAAANRDPAVYTEPDRFDIDRGETAAPLAFGFGRHHCLGAHLARAETEALLSRLLPRRPRLVADEVRWSPNPTIRGVEALPVQLDA